MKENESSEWEQSGCQNKGVRCEISHKGTGAFQFEASEQSKDWTSLRHFIESCLSVTIIGSLERLNSFNARICSSNSSSEQEEINECCQLQFEKKTCLFLCWGNPATPVIFSGGDGFRNFDLRFNYTAGLFLLFFQRPRGKVFSLCLCGNKFRWLFQASTRAMTLRWAVSQPSYLVKNWKLMVWRRRRRRTAAAHLSVSQWRVCCFGPAGCDGTERVSAALGNRRLATFQWGMSLSRESPVGMWIRHNAYPSDGCTHEPKTQIGV